MKKDRGLTRSKFLEKYGNVYVAPNVELGSAYNLKGNLPTGDTLYVCVTKEQPLPSNACLKLLLPYAGWVRANSGEDFDDFYLEELVTS